MTTKAHETGHASQRTLTPEEVARRKAVMEGGDPTKSRFGPVQTSEHGGPVESHPQRVARATAAVNPVFVDYDRDGYPDAIVGRSGRNLRQRAQLANGVTDASLMAATASSVAARRSGKFGGTYSLGVDGYRQDQIGYRERLRARIELISQMEDVDEDTKADARLRAITDMTVVGHGSTGVPGGMPAGLQLPTEEEPPPEGAKAAPTPAEQAAMAPSTPRTGFVNKGASRASIAVPVPPGGGIPGPEGTIRRGSYGSVPVQGTIQPGGGFLVHNEEAGSEPPEEGEGKSKHKTTEHAKTEHTKAAEHLRSAEHTAKSAEHTAKSAEHTVKTAEHAAKPHEHKPPEHTRHTEPHKK